MRYMLTALAAGALLVASLAAPAMAGPTLLSAKMNGKQEVPGPGDKNGKGDAALALKKKKRKVCFEITYERIAAPAAGHIHKGKKGVAGPIKVTLFESQTQGFQSPIKGCAKKVKRRLIKKLNKHPERYYVNLHNEEFPDGAIRGQLKFG